jgi:predicted O-methyltransferase YrrM
MSELRPNDLSFCPVLEEMVATQSTVDRAGNKTSVRGLSTVNNLVVLRNLCKAIAPAATLEIGLAYGASALVFAQSHRDNGAPPNAQHLAIDPFQHEVGFAGLTAVERAGLSGYLHHIADFSDRTLPKLLDQARQFGLVYIDGSHLFEDVFIDCHYVAQLLAPNGIVVFDDSSDPHVAKVIRFIAGNMCHVLTEIDLSPYRADAGKSLQYNVAKLVGRVQLKAFRKSGHGRRAWDSKLKPF